MTELRVLQATLSRTATRLGKVQTQLKKSLEEMSS